MVVDHLQPVALGVELSTTAMSASSASRDCSIVTRATSATVTAPASAVVAACRRSRAGLGLAARGHVDHRLADREQLAAVVADREVAGLEAAAVERDVDVEHRLAGLHHAAQRALDVVLAGDLADACGRDARRPARWFICASASLTRRKRRSRSRKAIPSGESRKTASSSARWRSVSRCEVSALRLNAAASSADLRRARSPAGARRSAPRRVRARSAGAG